MVTFDFAKTPITQIADAIIIDASRRGASDIHLDPRSNGIMVRIRVDGDLADYAYIPKVYERNLTTRIKLMSNMNITESRLPQDGAIKGQFGGKELDMRVSCLPTNEGEKIVIRILDYTRSLAGLDKLGFNQENYKKLLRMISAPNGIILVTGATGSGKSTTVYSILQVLNKERTNIITVEDPIEMNIEGLNQVQVNSEIGLDFAAVLRSILRQDPNVILIGEIRDGETAQIAVRASITGHLVLSTIHTNNSLSTIERLLDMNVEKYLLSSAITGIISQRLAKGLCTKCRIKRKTTEYERKVFKLALNQEVGEIFAANQNGCPSCNKGYHGRIAIQEVLEINDEIKSAINNAISDKQELRRLVYGTENVITLLQDGLGKVLNGLTSFEEIYRIIEIDNDIDDSYVKVMNKALTSQKEQEEVKQQKREQRTIDQIEKSSNAIVNKNTESILANSNEKGIEGVQNQGQITTTNAVSISKNILTNQDLKKEKNPLVNTKTNKNSNKGNRRSDHSHSKTFFPNPNIKKLKSKDTKKMVSSNVSKENVQTPIIPIINGMNDFSSLKKESNDSHNNSSISNK